MRSDSDDYIEFVSMIDANENANENEDDRIHPFDNIGIVGNNNFAIDQPEPPNEEDERQGMMIEEGIVHTNGVRNADVLIQGQSSWIRGNEGNFFFRIKAGDNFVEYNASSKAEKRPIILSILASIERRGGWLLLQKWFLTQPNLVS